MVAGRFQKLLRLLQAVSVHPAQPDVRSDGDDWRWDASGGATRRHCCSCGRSIVRTIRGRHLGIWSRRARARAIRVDSPPADGRLWPRFLDGSPEYVRRACG